MPEYKRFIAYFYEYIDGEKQKNAGFAKVELRNGMWRILFRLTTDSHPEPPEQVYGFVREQGWLLGLLMGTMRPESARLEEWAYHAGTPVWKQKYGFSDLAGIWIQSGDGRCYVTVWDDEPIQTERFVLEVPQNRPLTGTVEAAEVSEAEAVMQPSQTQETGCQKDTLPTERAEEMAEEAAASTEPGRFRYLIMERTDGNPANEGPGDENSAEEMIPDAKTVSIETAVSESGGTEKASIDEAGTDAADTEAESAAAAEGTAVGIEAFAAGRSAIDTETAIQSFIWKELFHKRQHFEPFEDTEFTNCIQIMPCDMMRLQQAGWQVGRSSFLLHGFYQYHHLLFGAAGDGRFVLGVPGNPNAQERYMAQMFGFGAFKTARWLDGGRQFGYWYRILPAK